MIFLYKILIALCGIMPIGNENNLSNNSIIVPCFSYSDNVIDTFIWQSPIDRASIKKKKRIACLHPLLYKDKIIFNNYEMSGFVALEKETGKVKWDNRGTTNPNYAAYAPIVNKDRMYYVKTCAIREIDLNSGNLISGYLWADSTAYLDSRINIHNNTLYAPINEFKDHPAFAEWVTCETSKLNDREWNTFNHIVPSDNKEKKVVFHKPAFYKNIEGHQMMLYTQLNVSKDWQSNTDDIVAYNLSKKEVEWRIHDFTIFSSSNEAPIIEDNRAYIFSGREAFCYNIYTGSLIWKKEAKEVNDLLSRSAGKLIHNDALIICGAQKEILAVDKLTGETIWNVEFPPNQRDQYAEGSIYNTANIYNNHLYYLSAWGSLISVNLSNGTYERYHLPNVEKLPEYDIKLYRPNFKDQSLIIDKEGIAYTSDGLRFLAFKVPCE